MKHIIDNNFYRQEKYGDIPISVDICGHCGIGKTSVVEQLAKEYDANFVKLNLSMMCETGDLCGYPIREHYVCKDNDCQWITPELIESFSKAGYNITSETRMSYALPTWYKDIDTSKPTFFVLDDYNRAIPALLSASMELVHRQEYLSWKLPSKTQIILTSNYDDGSYTGQHALLEIHVQETCGQRAGPGAGSGQRDAHKQQQRPVEAAARLSLQFCPALMALL